MSGCRVRDKINVEEYTGVSVMSRGGSTGLPKGCTASLGKRQNRTGREGRE